MVTVTAKDVFNNQSQCTFNVTVTDGADPTIAVAGAASPSPYHVRSCVVPPQGLFIYTHGGAAGSNASGPNPHRKQVDRRIVL